ncbi:MAG: membrane dipeptidase [Thermoproteus sp.]|nr:membrane dipeptidase [Thermoproteus sp.]
MFKHPRNVDDEVLEALKKNGGVVGITAIPSIIGGSGSADDLANHVFYIRDSFGPDLLAIGTDALGVDAMPRGLEAVDKVPAFLELLKAKGLSDSEAEALAYRNAKRVLEANLG